MMMKTIPQQVQRPRVHQPLFLKQKLVCSMCKVREVIPPIAVCSPCLQILNQRRKEAEKSGRPWWRRWFWG